MTIQSFRIFLDTKRQMKYTIIMIVRRINGISVGDNTQNQLQLITLHSFSTMNASCNNSMNETPPFTALRSDDSVIYITSPDKIDFCKRRWRDLNPRAISDLSVFRTDPLASWVHLRMHTQAQEVLGCAIHM